MKIKFKGIFILLFLLVGGSVSVFSQQIFATFGLGSQIESYTTKNFDGGETDHKRNGTTAGVSVLFIGSNGFAISTGSYGTFNIGEDYGNYSPVFGLGYVYYDNFYIGGILNFVPEFLWFHDALIAPTIVGGYDFNGIILGAETSYMYGAVSNSNRFKYTLVIGLSMGEIFR